MPVRGWGPAANAVYSAARKAVTTSGEATGFGCFVMPSLSDCLRPDGIFSLMFYNAHGLLFRNLLLENIRSQRLMTTQRRRSGSLQPPHPLTGEQIDRWLTALSLTTLTKSGVRVFSDYWQPSVQQSFDPQAIVALEQHDCRQPAFVSLGRYLHYLVQKPLWQLSRVGIRGVDESSG